MLKGSKSAKGHSKRRDQLRLKLKPNCKIGPDQKPIIEVKPKSRPVLDTNHFRAGRETAIKEMGGVLSDRIFHPSLQWNIFHYIASSKNPLPYLEYFKTATPSVIIKQIARLDAGGHTPRVIAHKIGDEKKFAEFEAAIYKKFGAVPEVKKDETVTAPVFNGPTSISEALKDPQPQPVKEADKIQLPAKPMETPSRNLKYGTW